MHMQSNRAVLLSDKVDGCCKGRGRWSDDLEAVHFADFFFDGFSPPGRDTSWTRCHGGRIGNRNTVLDSRSMMAFIPRVCEYLFISVQELFQAFLLGSRQVSAHDDLLSWCGSISRKGQMVHSGTCYLREFRQGLVLVNFDCLIVMLNTLTGTVWPGSFQTNVKQPIRPLIDGKRATTSTIPVHVPVVWWSRVCTLPQRMPSVRGGMFAYAAA